MEKIYEAIVEIKRPILEWEKWARRIARASRKVLGDCRVIVFGSVVEGKQTGGSDVDILIITKKKHGNIERGKIIAKIEEEAGLPPFHPFEIHLVNEKEAKWYFRHIKKYIEIPTKEN